MFKPKKNLSRYQTFFISYTLILVIPIIVLVITSYLLIQSFIIDGIMDKEVDKTTFQTQLFNGFYKQINKTVNDANKLIFMTDYIKENQATVNFDIKKFLSEHDMQSDFVEQLFFYQIETEQVFSRDGIESEEFFFDYRISPYFSNNLQIQEIDEAMFLQGKKHRKQQQQLFYIVPFEKNFNQGKYSSYMIFMINMKFIQNTSQQLALTDEEMFVLVFNNRPVFVNDSHVNSKIYDANFVSIAYELGKGYVRIKPKGDNLLYTERFIPKSDLNRSVVSVVLIIGIVTVGLFTLGLVFIIFVLKKNYRPILDTIYHVRSETGNMEQGIDEYLMINQAMIDLIEDKRKLQRTMKRLSYEKLFYQLLSSEEGHKKDVIDDLHAQGVNLNFSYYLCAILYRFTINDEDTPITFDNSDKGIKNNQIHIIEISNTQLIYVVGGEKEQIDYIYESLINFKKGETVDLHLGIGYVVRGLKRINQSYKRAQLTSERAVQQNENVCYDLDENVMPYPSMELMMLKEYLELDHLDRAVFTLNYLKEFISTSKNPYVSSEIYWEIIHIVEEQYNRHEISAILGEDCRQLQSVKQHIFIDILVERMERIIFGINALNVETELTKTKYYKQIDNVINYIRENYRNINFSIKTMAAYFDTTSSNLSQYFKKSTGKNLSEYIDALKLNYAKNILEKGQIKINDIARELGYSGPSAFIKKFKQLEGMTPGEYRQQMMVDDETNKK